MLRSVFSRLLVPYVLILLLVLLMQSLLVTRLFQRDYYEKAERELTQQSRQVADLAITAYYPGQGQDLLVAAMALLSQKYGAAVWLVDRFGNILQVESNYAGSLGAQSTAGDTTLTRQEVDEYLTQVMTGQFIRREGTFNNRFSVPVLTLGFPVASQGEVVGALFVHAQLSQYRHLDGKYYFVIGAFLLATSLIGGFIILLLARRMSRPLHQMNGVVSRIAKGDFAQRVDINSEDEIGELAANFNHMAESIQKHEQLYSGFVANVSHELRSPVTSMQGFAQGMLDGTIPQEEHPKYLAIIRNESVRLTALIRDLLNLAQIEAGEFPLDIRRFELNELIRRVLVRYVDTFESAEVTLEVNLEPEFNHVLADADRIEQVLVNLIHNATKFVNKGGEIRLWTRRADGKVYLCIANTGELIPEEDLPYVFERFYKVDKAHTGKSGTGLGLSIVQRIIEQHGQSISVRSSAAGGTSFTFSLDAAPQ